jgi:hypothetical protein
VENEMMVVDHVAVNGRVEVVEMEGAEVVGVGRGVVEDALRLLVMHHISRIMFMYSLSFLMSLAMICT